MSYISTNLSSTRQDERCPIVWTVIKRFAIAVLKGTHGSLRGLQCFGVVHAFDSRLEERLHENSSGFVVHAPQARHNGRGARLQETPVERRKFVARAAFTS